jgi:hypothetical protein
MYGVMVYEWGMMYGKIRLMGLRNSVWGKGIENDSL